MLHTTALHHDGLASIRKIRDEAVDPVDRVAERLSRLSPREREILTLFAEGLSNQEIADRLFLSLNTVRNYGRTLLEKLDLHTKVSAAVLAARLDERRRASALRGEATAPVVPFEGEAHELVDQVAVGQA